VTHQTLHRFCRVSYWNDNSAASVEEEWTHCKVTPFGMYTYGEQSFENTKQGLYDKELLVAFLQNAYERGRSDAKKEIRDVLGVKDPRS